MKPTNQPRPLPSTDAATIDLSLFPGFTEFFAAYIEAALQLSDDEQNRPLTGMLTPEMFDSEALAVLQAHALSFWSRAKCYIDEVRAPYKEAGYDFWLTQQRHGCGFWDGGWGEYGDTLTKLSHCYPELCLDVTEEGVIYVNPA